MAAQMAVLTPLLLLLLTALFQFVAWEHAVHVADEAAHRGVDAARFQGGTVAAGQDETTSLLDRLAPTIILGRQVTVTRSSGAVRVEVTGYADQLLPWLRLPVDAVAEGPVERFRPAGETP